MKRKSRIIVSVLMTALFVGYYAYNAAFAHTHYVNNETITHSHPFSSSHSHTSAGFQALQSLLVKYFFSSSQMHDICVFRVLIAAVDVAILEGIESFYFDNSSSRAPPVSLLS